MMKDDPGGPRRRRHRRRSRRSCWSARTPPSGKKTIVATGSLTLLKHMCRVDFGIRIFSPTADAVGPGELAAWLEERGFESLVFAEHTHIPAGREVPITRAAARCRRKYNGGPSTSSSRLTAARGWRPSGCAFGSGIALIVEARPDHHRQRGRALDRRPLRRGPLRARRRRRVEEPRGDGKPRHWTRVRGCNLFAERTEAIKAIWTGA